MISKARRLAFGALAAGCLQVFCAGAALAQDNYPNRPIKFILGFGPGSATDNTARIVAQKMSAAMGQPIIVENRPGALSTLATEAVARSAPDGYTILIGANSGLSTGPAGFVKSVRYDPLKDLEPVGRIIQASYLLVVAPQLGAKTVADVINIIKRDPSKRNCASGNANSRVFCELFKRKAGVDLAIVPYKSTPESTMAVMGGQATMQFLDFPSALPRINASQLNALAVMQPKRSEILPNVLTAPEAGLGGIPLNVGWVSMQVPAKTPKAIVERLNKELNAVLRSPELRANLAQGGYEVTISTPEELGDYTRQDLESWRTLIKELNIPVEG